MPNKILFVEDDAMITSGLLYALEQEGYSVIHSKNVYYGKKAIYVRVQSKNRA
jgi:DNA-binding response OmpR family regulator